MKSIIIYFSRAGENYGVGFLEKGNTEVVSEYIKEVTNSDMFKVEPLIPYSTNYETCTIEAKERQESHNAPIKEKLPDLKEYDLIYLGSPIYWDFMPEELVTALKSENFSGKTIKPFTTHEGSGLGMVITQIKEICPNAKVLDGLKIQGSLVKKSKDEVIEWAQKF